MDRKKLSIRLISLIFFIFIVNYIANAFYWYSLIWYFDMPMHFLGGFWLGLYYVWLFPLKESETLLSFVVKAILGVLLVGILWEIFQILVNNFIAQNPFDALDTLSDIFFDLAGGSCALIYFFKRIMFTNKNRVQ